MLSAGADPCIENSAGDTPLHLAVDAGNDSSVLALLQCGAKADAFDTRGVGPLHIACKRGNARVTHWLLTFGKASPNKLTERSKSALHYAINGALSSTQNHSGVTDCVDLRLAAGANPNVASRTSLETPLHIAARCGHSKVVSALMRRGANVRLSNCDKDEPQKIALRYGQRSQQGQADVHRRKLVPVRHRDGQRHDEHKAYRVKQRQAHNKPRDHKCPTDVPGTHQLDHFGGNLLRSPTGAD